MPPASSKTRFDILADKFPKKELETLHETMGLSAYIDRVYSNPALARSAYQRLYDMIIYSL
jgi:hypothetical protein